MLHLRGLRRRRALRQDGAQRHRVRRHAAHRRGVRPAAPGPRCLGRGDRADLRAVEHGRPGVVPHRDHRRRAAARGRRDRPGLRRHRAGPGRAEGHRPLDRAERPGPGRAHHGHRGGHVRARPVRLGAAARRRPRGAPGPRGRVGGQGPGRLHRGRPPGPVRLQGRGLLAGLRPDRGGRHGVRLGHRPRRHGSHLARRLHHPCPVPEPDHRGVRARRRTSPCCSRTSTSPTPSRAACPRGAASWPVRLRTACRRRRSRPRSRTTTASAPSGCPAALVQAQRDFFGAHTYKRVDREGTFHTEWSGDRTEAEA